MPHRPSIRSEIAAAVTAGLGDAYARTEWQSGLIRVHTTIADEPLVITNDDVTGPAHRAAGKLAA